MNSLPFFSNSRTLLLGLGLSWALSFPLQAQRHGLAIVGMRADANPGQTQLALSYTVDGVATHPSVTGDKGVQNPAAGQLWKTSVNFIRFDREVLVEVRDLGAGRRVLGSRRIVAADPAGRMDVPVRNGNIQLTLVMSKHDFPEPTPRNLLNRMIPGQGGTPDRYHPQESFSFFGNLKDPVPSILPIGDQGTEGACVAWAITSTVGSTLIASTLESGYDKRDFLRKGFNLLDAVWLYDQRPDKSSSGWSIPDALDLAKSGKWIIPCVGNPKYGVRIDGFERITDASQIRYMLAVTGRPLATQFNVTQEFNSFRDSGVFMGSVNNVRTGGHAVTIVGYNHPSRTTTLGLPYWEVQNSWGKQYARNGYFLALPGATQIADAAWDINNAVLCERQTGRVLTQAESTAVLRSIINRPRTDFNSANVLGGRGKFAEPVDDIVPALRVIPDLGNRVRIVLKAGPNINWWKSIKIYENGKMVKELWTQDNTKTSPTFDVITSPTGKYHIEFCKAKTFGVHTPIKKHSFDLWELQGKELSFTWMRDE